MCYEPAQLRRSVTIIISVHISNPVANECVISDRDNSSVIDPSPRQVVYSMAGRKASHSMLSRSTNRRLKIGLINYSL